MVMNVPTNWFLYLLLYLHAKVSVNANIVSVPMITHMYVKRKSEARHCWWERQACCKHSH